jgi:hypothetical protein
VNWEKGLQRMGIVCSVAVLVLGIVRDARTLTEYQRAEVTFRDGKRYTVVLPHLRQLVDRVDGTAWLYPYWGEWSQDKLVEAETRIYGTSRNKFLTDQGDVGPFSQEKLDRVVSRISKEFKEAQKIFQEFGGLIFPHFHSKREQRVHRFKLLGYPLGEPEDFLFDQIAAELVTTHTVPQEPMRAITVT